MNPFSDNREYLERNIINYDTLGEFHQFHRFHNTHNMQIDEKNFKRNYIKESTLHSND